MTRARLVIDIGNTQAKFALVEPGALNVPLAQFSVPSRAEDFAALPEKLQSWTAGFSLSEGVCLASVVPALNEILLPMLVSLFPQAGKPLVIIPGETPSPVDFSRYRQGALGADRFVDVCAVSALYPDQTVGIVDFGTATTIDVVSADRQYLGGVILPGIQTFFAILHEKTAQLPLVSPAPVNSPLGLDTQSSLAAGLNLGYVGMMEKLLADITHTLKASGDLGNPIWVATGGLATTFEHMRHSPVSLFQEIDPLLTLKGLSFLYDQACFSRCSG